MEHKIDATNQKLGRLASQIAVLLRGKQKTDFAQNLIPTEKVTVTNAAKLSIPEKRMREKAHEMYSGYPGGFKTDTNQKIVDKKGWKGLYELAVYGMLPNNKLRPLMMKRLTVTE